MTDVEQRQAAKKFVEYWTGRGDEKQETQRFWIDLLRNVLGVENPETSIEFELPVKLDHTSFIDAYIDQTRVLIEQKGQDINLRSGYRQSDGSMLTPFGQARRYAGYLPHDKNPRWIVVCNFREFNIHDMNRPNDPPEVVYLADLEKEVYRLKFISEKGNDHLKREMEVSIAAGEIVGLLYDALAKQYSNPETERALKSLNILCVRLVFCLYAEDAGIFGHRGMFRDYLVEYDARRMRKAVIELFNILDTPVDQRDPYLKDDAPALAAFPYVNGGLFADEDIEIPPFTDEIRTLLLEKASDDFDWSEISPTIFGAVFESTLNPETRRSGGMHYTSIENIHKVIDPLFLNDLNEEFAQIRDIPVERTKERKLREFQQKLASLSFLDPACGSGNFLTETYISLRRIENEVLRALWRGQIGVGGIGYNPIQVSISQFYGIEINDFAVTVAKTALWIAESQMLKETESIVLMQLDFLPLTTNAYIHEGNALQVDWEAIVPKHQLSYIMGNPPFVGKKEQSPGQKKELMNLYGKGISGVGNMDYVTGWYIKAAEYMQNTNIQAAFVSTNSISQGEQPPILWSKLVQYNVDIVFAHRTFVWENEASNNAHVHCVIIGFTVSPSTRQKTIFESPRSFAAKSINPYLVDAPTVIIKSRSSSICSEAPKIFYGSMPIDDGNLILNSDDVNSLLSENKENAKYIRRYVGGAELIKGTQRWCLWLVGANPRELQKSQFIKSRLMKTAVFRQSSNRPQTLALAETPSLFGEIRQPNTNMIAIPKVSSENRRYIPLSFVSPDIIVNGSALIIPGASLYHFGVLFSNVHNCWMRAVAGRLEMRYQYSNTVVYNNFPWPTPTDEQKAKIEQTAQAILDARALYPDSSLADLYDEVTMPPELRRAHQLNDRAVMQAYGFSIKDMNESTCVAELMKLYQALTAEK